MTIVALSLVLALSWMVGRSLLFPPALLTGTWLLSVVFLAASSGLLPIEPTALAVFLVGTSAFVLGGIAMDWADSPRTAAEPRTHHRAAGRVIDAFLAILVVGLPFYWLALLKGVGSSDAGSVLHSIRAAQLEQVDEASSFNPVMNLAVISQFVAAASFLENGATPGRRWRAVLAVVLAFVYGAMGGAKANAVMLVLTLAFLSSFRAGRLRVGVVLGAAFGAVGVFAVGLLVINFAYGDSSTLQATLTELVETVQSYWLGGLVAFGTVAVNPNVIESTIPIERFFLETGRSLGMSVHVPPTHAAYTMVSSTAETNTYTFYFCYFKELGWAGTCVVMAVLGAIVTFVYRRALRGSAVATLLCARFSVGLVLSIHSEHFFTALNSYIKFGLFLALLYALPALWSGSRGKVLQYG
jgi:oligosaccharide repeat unit polymerase